MSDFYHSSAALPIYTEERNPYRARHTTITDAASLPAGVGIVVMEARAVKVPRWLLRALPADELVRRAKLPVSTFADGALDRSRDPCVFVPTLHEPARPRLRRPAALRFACVRVGQLAHYGSPNGPGETLYSALCAVALDLVPHILRIDGEQPSANGKYKGCMWIYVDRGFEGPLIAAINGRMCCGADGMYCASTVEAASRLSAWATVTDAYRQEARFVRGVPEDLLRTGVPKYCVTAELSVS